MADLAVVNTQLRDILRVVQAGATESSLADIYTKLEDLGSEATLYDVLGVLQELLTKEPAHYQIVSTDEFPTDASVGDDLVTVDNGNYYIYYGGEWHLKILGTYTPITFTLTFDAGDGTPDPATKEVTYDSTYGALATTTYAGYTLLGWFFDALLSDEVTAGDTVRIEDDTTVYAKYEPIEYTITYNLDGGTNAEANPATYTIETEFVFNAATKDASVFEGWYTDPGMAPETEKTQIALGETGNLTLYAKWSAA